MRSKIFLAGLVVILLFANLTIVFKERAIAHGSTVILGLAPVDPRSLMQGDYMELGYLLSDMVAAKDKDGALPEKGTIYLLLNSQGVAVDVFFESKPGLIPLRYQHRQGRYEFGVESFFFQEGQGLMFEEAQYGQLKVDSRGNPILTHLLDQNLGPIGP